MLILYIFILLLSFYILAKIVDNYFVAALDEIAVKLKMSYDAAGATLMAVGSSAPELFVALFAVLRPGDHEAVGIGNIVGSALFNILAIIGASAIVRKATIAKQSVFRDFLFYAIAVGLLLVIIIDGKVTYTEAGILLIVYGLYVFAVIKWRKIFKYEDPDDESQNIKEPENTKKTLFQKIVGPIDTVIDLFFPPIRYHLPVFFISIVFIAGISWVLVESAVQIARIAKISETVIALTVLAAGTSVPDLISSVIVSKKGRGGMAISNAVGSNIFDILVGLGLPFLLIIFISGENLTIQAENIKESVYFLSVSIIIVLIFFLISRWKVGKMFGYLLLLLYISYLVWAIFNV
jgi:K+-dependent Na+/Ca+ exchanger-like protein